MGAREPVGPHSQVVYHLNIQIKQGVERVHKKVGILKVGEHKKVNHNAHDHPKFFPAQFSRTVNQVPQVIVRKGGKDQNQEKQTRGFPVKKEAGPKQKGIPHGPLPVNPRINQQHYRVECPEKKAGEDQGLLRVKKEYVT